MNEGHSEKTLLSDGKGRKEKAEKAKTQRVKQTRCAKHGGRAGHGTGSNLALFNIHRHTALHDLSRPFPDFGAIIDGKGSGVKIPGIKKQLKNNRK